MIKDFAIDPDSIDKLSYLRYLHDSMGFEKGRLIHEIPIREKWILDVTENARTDPDFVPNSKEHEIILTHLFKSGFSRKSTTIDENESWMSNAMMALSNEEVVAIVTTTASENTIPISTLSSLNPLWNTRTDMSVKRSANHFRPVLLPVISRARRMKIIDPYFDITEERFYKFLRLCYTAASSSKGIRIEIHCDGGHCSSFATLDFEKNWKTSLETNVGRRGNVEVKIVVWREMKGSLKIHDRYLLTELGGIRIPTGLDLIGEHDKADISRMGYEVYSDIYSRYDSNGNNPELKFIGSYTIK